MIDFNITTINSVPTIPGRVKLGASFFRADTGEDATRPTNRVDAVNLDGNILDHFFGAHVSFDFSRCLNTFAHDSDHHPIMTRVSPMRLQTDNSIRYWRINLEKLAEPSCLNSYVQAVEAAVPTIRASMSALFPTAITRSSTALFRQSTVNAIEHCFVSAITNIASSVLGRKPVKLATSRKPIAESAEYRQIRQEMDAVFNHLLRYSGINSDHPRVQET